MDFDVVIIGGGVAGYSCAVKLGEFGKKVCLIEKDFLGGTCLNVGCIPSKALLDSSKFFFKLRKNTPSLSPDLKRMMAEKTKAISTLSEGIKFLIKKNRITFFQGEASFISPTSIEIRLPSRDKKNVNAPIIVIATGSKPAELKEIPIDGEKVITSNEALSLEKIHSNLVIIGGGAIGLELGSVFARLGSKVKIVEYFDRLIPSMDFDLSRSIQRILEKELAIEFFLSHKVLSSVVKDNLRLRVTDENNNEKEIVADLGIVAVGRNPNVENLGLEKIGINKITVDSEFRTSIPHIYAIGDVIGGPMLAHKAQREGMAVADLICGIKRGIDYRTIPFVVYTSPEVASVGVTELKEKHNVFKLPLKINGRAQASGETEGFLKVVAEKETKKIVGVHMIAPHASDIISEASLAIKFEATTEDIAQSWHPHPTYSELFYDVCLNMK